jgi:AcrR family transcriptional regulator
MGVKTKESAARAEAKPSARLSARDRLLAAADELFYSEGVHVVGVDRIVERAGVTKATLYSTFGSKEELVRAYLDKHFQNRQRSIARILAAHNTPRDRLLGVFAELEGALAGSEFRGCRFIMASAEARPDDASEVVAEEYRVWLQSLFAELGREAGVNNPKEFGRQVSLLYDGAPVAARNDPDRPGAAGPLRAAGVALLDAATSPRRSTGRRAH